MFTSKKDKLFTAIVENDLVAAEKLLKGGLLNNNVSPNYQQKVTPWIQSGQIKVGDKQNSWEVFDLSPLHLAIVLNRPQMVKKLLEYTADANKQTVRTQFVSPIHVVSEVLTPLLLSVCTLANAVNNEEEKGALEIYSALRAANARLVGVDTTDSSYMGVGVAQDVVDIYLSRPDFKQAHEDAEIHYQLSTQKSVFVEKLAEREERNNGQPKAYPNQQIKL